MPGQDFYLIALLWQDSPLFSHYFPIQVRTSPRELRGFNTSAIQSLRYSTQPVPGLLSLVKKIIFVFPTALWHHKVLMFYFSRSSKTLFFPLLPTFSQCKMLFLFCVCMCVSGCEGKQRNPRLRPVIRMGNFNLGPDRSSCNVCKTLTESNHGLKTQNAPERLLFLPLWGVSTHDSTEQQKWETFPLEKHSVCVLKSD